MLNKNENTVKVEIREAQKSDLGNLSNLYDRSVKKLATELYTPEQIQAWSQFSKKAEEFVHFIFKAKTFLLEVNGVLVAFCGYEKDGHIASLYSSPEWKGHGYGKKLLLHAMADANQYGIDTFHCEASFLSKSLFASVGFEVVEIEKVAYDAVFFDRYKMQRNKSCQSI